MDEIKKITYLKCPSCGDTNISQYRMPTGPIWCLDCGHRVEQKELDGSFYTTDKPKETN